MQTWCRPADLILRVPGLFSGPERLARSLMRLEPTQHNRTRANQPSMRDSDLPGLCTYARRTTRQFLRARGSSCPGSCRFVPRNHSRAEGLRGRRARKYLSSGDGTVLLLWVQTTCRSRLRITSARESGAAAYDQLGEPPRRCRASILRRISGLVPLAYVSKCSPPSTSIGPVERDVNSTPRRCRTPCSADRARSPRRRSVGPQTSRTRACRH